MKKQRLKDFVNGDLKQFSQIDNIRSIPSVVDGFKDSQRKSVYGLLKHGTSELKVSQLSEYVSMATDYLHGSASLCGTIVGLAQDYPGSNNVNLFEPIGQFGNILSPKAAAARYIYTKQSDYIRKLILKEDESILEHRIEEGTKLEPIHYLPLIPLWFLNGAKGVGTGHAVDIQSRSIKDAVSLVKKIIKGQDVSKLEDPLPFYKGWKGTVERGESVGQYVLTGKLEVKNTTTLSITELPVGYDVDKYKGILIKLMDDGVLKDFDNNSTESGFDFLITVPRETSRKSMDDLIKLFKLQSRVTENITLWSTDGALTKYNSVIEALTEAVNFRLEKYVDRKAAMLKQKNLDLLWLTSKKTFITYWLTKLKDPQKKTTEQIKAELLSNTDLLEEYLSRLLDLKISTLTKEQVEKLEQEIKSLKQEITDLEATKVEDIYINELSALRT